MTRLRFLFTALLLHFACWANGQIDHDQTAKTIRVATADNRLAIYIDHSMGCKVTSLEINKKNTLAPAGMSTAIQTAAKKLVSTGGATSIKVSLQARQVTLDGIMLGDVDESWRFIVDGNKILWTICGYQHPLR